MHSNLKIDRRFFVPQFCQKLQRTKEEKKLRDTQSFPPGRRLFRVFFVFLFAAIMSASGLLPRLLSLFVAVDDRVMGGVSQSHVVASPVGHPVFRGELVARGGGFCSTRWFIPPLSLHGASMLHLEAVGDGRIYRFTARTAADDKYYQTTFKTRAGEKVSHAIEITAMEARWRGRALPGAPTLRGEEIVSLGIMVDKGPYADSTLEEQCGPFSLEIVSLLASGTETGLR